MTLHIEIENLLKAALQSTLNSLGNDSVESDNTFLEKTQDPIHGDFATSLPLKLCKQLKVSPIELARLLASNIPNTSILSKTPIFIP